MSKSPDKDPIGVGFPDETAFHQADVAMLARMRDEIRRKLQEADSTAAVGDALRNAMRENAEALERIIARLERVGRLEDEVAGLRLENESLRSVLDVQGKTIAEISAMKDAIQRRYEENLVLYRVLSSSYENLSVAHEQVFEHLKIEDVGPSCNGSKCEIAGRLCSTSHINGAETEADDVVEGAGESADGGTHA